MLPPLLLTLSTLTHVHAQVPDPPGLGFGPTYLMPRTSSYLIGYSTTLRVPRYPGTSEGLAVVWPGINTDARPTNLVQTIVGAERARRSSCLGKATGQQWCAFTSTNIGITQQKSGKGIPVEEGTDLFITYKYDETTKQFTQTLSIDGKEVSRQSLAVGKGTRFNTAVEVQRGFSGTIAAHSYRNNTFTFAAADPGFPGSLRVGRGIVASEPVTADGGKVWTVDEILIPDSKYGSARTAASPP
ncbi:hypothetical protein Vi05172_g8019 [Venturia inaequalis]|nr:hypothetical protein Vi05172_g8019 [Venturia inaequalis]